MKRLAFTILMALSSSPLWADAPGKALLYDYRPASGPVLVLKSRDAYFKLHCDDSNKLESMIRSLGFPAGEKPLTITADKQEVIFNDIKDHLVDDAFYCAGFSSFTDGTVPPPAGDQPVTFSNAYRLLEDNSKFYAWNFSKNLVYQLSCDGFKEGVELFRNSGKPYTVTPRIFEKQTKGNFDCAAGTVAVNPGAPSFKDSTLSSSILAGSDVHQKVNVSDPDGDAVSVFLQNKGCPWLSYNKDTQEIEGTSYPATVPYNCSIELNAFAGKDPSVNSFKFSVRVEPIKITSLTTGYRRTCARFNNGKVSCWGTVDSKAGKIVKEMTTLAGADLIAANKTFDSSKKGIYFSKGQKLYFLRNGASQVDELGTLDQPIKALKAGPIPACVQTLDNKTECFGDSADNYDIPLDPETYANFDFGTGAFCGDAANNGKVACRYPEITLDLGAAGRPFAAGMKQVCGINLTGAVNCKSRDANDTVETLAPRDGFHKKISVGNDFSCAVTRDNKVKCWGGNNQYTQTFVKDEWFANLEVQDIFSGFDHSCVLGANAQTVVCWGSSFFNGNLDGVTGVPRTVNVNDMLPELTDWEVLR